LDRVVVLEIMYRGCGHQQKKPADDDSTLLSETQTPANAASMS
jgi:hypothetical protein